MIDLTYVIAAAIALVLAILTYVLYPLIAQKISAEKLAAIKEWANIAVKAAEMIFSGPGRGEEKKAYVVELLKKHGYAVDVAVIDAIIESAVLELKNLIGN